MWTHTAPLRVMQFIIEEQRDGRRRWREMPAFASLDADIARPVLEKAARFASGVLAPINGPADLQGSRSQDGAVTTPAGYMEASRAFGDGGYDDLRGLGSAPMAGAWVRIALAAAPKAGDDCYVDKLRAARFRLDRRSASRPRTRRWRP